VPSSPDWNDYEQVSRWYDQIGREVWRSNILARLRSEVGELPAEVEETFVTFKGVPEPEFRRAFEKLLGSDDPEVRIWAALFTWSSGPQSRLPILLEVFRGEYPTDCKVKAIGLMGFVDRDSVAEVLPTLCAVMREDQDPDVLLAAARAGWRLSKDVEFLVVPDLEHLLRHSSPVVFSAACSTLGSFGGRAASAVPSLLAKVKTAEPPEVRREAALALTRIDPGGKLLREVLVERSQRELLLAELAILRAEGKPLWVSLKAHWGDRTVPAGVSKHELETQGQEDEAGREVDLTAASHASAPPPRPTQRHRRAKIVRQIDRWSDLAIGIDLASGRIYALTPRPAIGEEFDWKKATPLELGDVQVTKVLRVLAGSKDGETASKKDLIVVLGFATTAGIDRMTIREDQALFDDNLRSKASHMISKLRVTMSHIKRLLEDMFPTSDPTPALVNVSDDEYAFAFVARHLELGPDGKLRFGEHR
jgi:hypothetical protein